MRLNLFTVLNKGLRSPREGHGNPLQYSHLENRHRQRSLAGYSPRGCKESDLTSWLSTHTHQLYSQFCVPRAFEKQGYILQFGGTPRYPKALWGTMRLNYSISEIKLVYCLIQFFYILTEFLFTFFINYIWNIWIILYLCISL